MSIRKQAVTTEHQLGSSKNQSTATTKSLFPLSLLKDSSNFVEKGYITFFLIDSKPIVMIAGVFLHIIIALLRAITALVDYILM